MARIAVLEFEQTPASEPVHFIPRRLKERFLSCYHHGRQAVIQLDAHTLWIRVKISFRKLKGWLRDPDPISRPLFAAVDQHYIPEYLPRLELPGLWFAGPRQLIRGYKLETNLQGELQWAQP